MIAPKDLPFKRSDFAEIQSLIGLTLDERRAFSWHNTNKYFRVKLWDKSRTCGICGYEIPHFRNSTLDHIVPRSMGGRTRERNLRLAHKKCNSSRNANNETYTGELLTIAFTPITKNTPRLI